MKNKMPKIKWTSEKTLAVFVHKMYEQANAQIPDSFYPEDEAPRLANLLRAQGMGIDISETLP